MPRTQLREGRMTIRAPKDFWAGVMFCGFAAIGILAAKGYSLGSAGKMGPGYFPLLLGIVLAAMGVILMARSVVVEGEPVSAAGPWASSCARGLASAGGSRSRAFTFCPSSLSQRRCACSAL